MMKRKALLLAAAACGSAIAVSAQAADRILVIGSDTTGSVVKAGLDGTGLFTLVDFVDRPGGTISIADFSGYNGALVYTNFSPSDPTGWGDTLQQFVDGGGQLTLATYAFSSPWQIDGGIMGAGYSPLLNSGSNGSVGGSLTLVNPDSVFDGVNLANATYFHNSNYAQPNLAPGATLLATDGATNMIARNAAGTVYAFNIYPGFDASADTFRLYANSLLGGGVGAVPEPSTWALLILGFAGIAASLRAQKKRQTVTVRYA